jgi:hypothetical protein
MNNERTLRLLDEPAAITRPVWNQLLLKSAPSQVFDIDLQQLRRIVDDQDPAVAVLSQAYGLVDLT